MEVSSPTIIVERAGSYAWEHKSWRVREEFARTVTSAINLFASTELPLQRAILPPILHMLNDPISPVREAAISCIEEMYMQIGPQFQEELQRHQLPSYMVKDINARLERIEPKPRSSEGAVSGSNVIEHKVANHNAKRNSPKAKNSSRETSLFGGDGDATEKPVEPVKVYSEKELIREFEKIASTLVPEKDWSQRIAAMQRFEGLVIGGAVDYPSFRGLLKQLVGPLSTQLSDRRSSIVKQACHLLNFLSKELLGDFEACAEQFIPVLFKLVVITVLVIAESADNCIKTMLRNCKVARVLSRIADCAKNDRSAVLRARCCEYALLVLEHWPDEPEIQRSADLYEDMIRRCVSDAVSEKTIISVSFFDVLDDQITLFLYRQDVDKDVVLVVERYEQLQGLAIECLQKPGQIALEGYFSHLILLYRGHASPSVRERHVPHTPQPSASMNVAGYGTSAIVAMDKTATLASRASVSSGMVSSQSKSLDKGSDRSLESVLNSSKEKVSAIESLLRGLDLSSKHNSSTIRSSSLDLGVDPPSSRDPPFPLAVPASNQVTSLSLDSKLSSVSSNNNRNGGLVHSDTYSNVRASKDSGKSSYRSGLMNEPSSTLISYSAKRASERVQERGYNDEQSDYRDSRRHMNSHMDRQYSDAPYRESTFRDSSYVPNFQRPLSRKNVTGRSTSSSRRRSFDDSHLPLGEAPSYVEGPASLHEALGEGLSSSSDWSARVAAFNYIRTLLQQGSIGIQEIVQSFEKVMKLFFKHLDDPHHKVAQAALLTLADIIPACRKPFESYMERILPHVFSRLIDPKEVVRQPCSTTLDIVGKTYGVDSLLPALLRSLDEQRSPKAKLAVIEFAIGSFNKHSFTSEGAGNSGILKLWLAKLTPLVHDKNTKLKEAAISCFISVYTHYDPTNVLNFILSLSVEEQNLLRRALKQYTPRIEVDLMNFLQSKKERQRAKAAYDPSDVVGTSSEEGYTGVSKKNNYYGRFSTNSPDSDGGRRWNSVLDSTYSSGRNNQAVTDETPENLYESLDTGYSNDYSNSRTKDKYLGNHNSEDLGSWTSRLENADSGDNPGFLSTPHMDTNGLNKSSDSVGISSALQPENGFPDELAAEHTKLGEMKIISNPETGPSIPQILHSLCNGNEGSSAGSKESAVHQLIEASVSNDPSIWSKYFNQILTTVLEVLADPDSSVRELKEAMEDSVEIVIEKLLDVSKDTTPKLVGRLSQEELMAQLPSFLPALFDAFGNQSADVRKTVVFCLVDIYIMLGKAFLPHLEGLNSTQLRLVTIYANRISQARTGAPIDAGQ
ncbi:CLIP-associated protein [Bienertia sinuspersici]